MFSTYIIKKFIEAYRFNRSCLKKDNDNVHDREDHRFDNNNTYPYLFKSQCDSYIFVLASVLLTLSLTGGNGLVSYELTSRGISRYDQHMQQRSCATSSIKRMHPPYLFRDFNADETMD